MRLVLALGLTLILGLSVKLLPSDNLPGSEVAAAETTHISGGCLDFNLVSCGGGSCGTTTCCLQAPVKGDYIPQGDACNSYCAIWLCTNDTCAQ